MLRRFLIAYSKNKPPAFAGGFRAKTNGLFAPLKEIIKQELSFILRSKLNFYYIRNMDFHCIFKGFDEKLRLLYSCTATLVFRQKYPHFSHSAQFADFVCKLKPPAFAGGLLLFIECYFDY